MLKQENDCGNNNWARVCDTCQSAACTVYCRADSAYLCGNCDARIHSASKIASRHERVYMCEACERAPAAFLCKADAASLCAGCDAEIHSANPLARRHQRVPILPIGIETRDGDAVLTLVSSEDEDEAASWLLLNNINDNSNTTNKESNNDNELMFDEYLELMEYNYCTENQFIGYNQQPEIGGSGDSDLTVVDKNANFQYGASKDAFSYSSMSRSVSSKDVAIVPDSTISDISHSNSMPPNGTIDHFAGPPTIQMPHQLTAVDREARVLRYREKKKARKFEKTIRYASRKAYAETRPRIKGRFAKRKVVEVDQMLSIPEIGYGIVPSF
ncbi:hypothetical protein ACFE04_007010 [Oxalis oulophora]